MRIRGGLAAALALATAVGACGGSGEPKVANPDGKGGTTRTADLVARTSPRPPAHKLVLDGVPLAGGRQWLLPVEIKLTNRRKRRLRLGSMSAELRDGGGASYRPIFADGRKRATPVFAEAVIPAGESVHTLVVYRVPARALRKAKVRVTDPVRGNTFDVTVF